MGAALAALAVAATTVAAAAAQPAPDRPAPALDGQVIKTALATVRVSAIKGLARPWALAFLPNGEILVSEQGRYTLRRIRNGILDPEPITGLPAGFASTQRETTGVDVAVHPQFAQNGLIYAAYWKLQPRLRQAEDGCAGPRPL